MKSRSPNKNTLSPNNEEKLKIVIRIRPVLNQEDPSMFVNLQDNDTLEIRRPGNISFMKFNNILPPESTQKDVFFLVEDSIRQFLKGINTTIFAYGQTGAGKTYSIIGNYSPNESQENLFNFLSSKQRGVLSRSLEMIMNIANKQPTYRFYVSFYQIYNQKIYDLYNFTNVGLEIRESKNGEISIPDLVTVQINKMQEAINFLMIGLRNRATGYTQANAKSSRSHSIFQISLERPEGDGIVTSALRIVDLAGSQKFKIPSDLTAAEKQIRIQELTSINGSLSCLGHCISALIDKTRTHIPFRNSKLTRILSDSLLGQGKMRFIICISPSVSASAQTFSTLQFANRAKRAIFDRIESKSSSVKKKKTSTEELDILKKDLEKQRQLREIIEKQLIQVKKQNSLLKHQNEKMMAKLQSGSSVVNRDSKNYEKDQTIASKVGYYDVNKQNELKDKILKLPIFQRNRKNPVTQNHCSPSPRANYTNNPSCDNQMDQNQVSQVSEVHMKATNINKKKTDFQKKIRKFIQSDSLNQSIQQNRNNPYSFDNEITHSQLQNNLNEHQKCMKMVYINHKVEQNQQEILWDSHKDDSNEFIQRACTKMNLPQFHQLKTQMQKARQELLNLRKKDNELQQRKINMK